MRAPITLAGLALAAAAFIAGCGGGGTTVSSGADAPTSAWDWARDAGLPAGFPEPTVPADNPMSTAKVELGRMLFYDKRLSGNGSQACASCHVQSRAFTDGLATSVGSTGEAHPRNAQPLANVAFSPTITWANPLLRELEQQANVPIFGTHPVEMGVNASNMEEVLGRLKADARYPALFAGAFAAEADPISFGNAIKAIASFQRTIFSGGSRYDQWLVGKASLSDAERRGLELFNSEKAECFHCHAGFNFNDQVVHAGSTFAPTPFHNTGLYNIDGLGGFPAPNRGLYEFTLKASDMGKFRAPTLRNVGVTAPYMHDGSISTLEEVLDFYAAGGRVIASGPYAGDGRSNPYKSDLIPRIQLSAQDKADLIAFLHTLTDDTLLTNPKLADPFAK